MTFLLVRKFLIHLRGHLMYTLGYRSTQLVIVKLIAFQSAPLIAQQLEQWLAKLTAMNFCKWENPLFSCVYSIMKLDGFPMSYLCHL